MSRLREILTNHSPALLLDAAAAQVTAGWLAADQPPRWVSSTGEAGTEIFHCLQQLDIDVKVAAAFLFCEGPGSVLGIRTAAMALRTWCVLRPRPIFAYGSLALLAHATGRADLGIIADARRDSWHHFQLGGKLRRVTTADLTGNLATPGEFRNWTPLPSDVLRLSYDLPELWHRAGDADFIRATTAPDAFLHEDPSYATWTPQVHRAPASR